MINITGMKNKATGLIYMSVTTDNEKSVQSDALFSIMDRIRNELLIRRKQTNNDSESKENSSTRQNEDEINTDMAIAK